MEDAGKKIRTDGNATEKNAEYVVMKDVYKIYDMGGNKIYAADGVTCRGS